MDNENKNTFTYTYSAKQQEEVQRIRKKYLPPEEDKMEQLRRLDRSSTRKGTIVSIIVGAAGCLLLGVGMCCTMVWMEVLHDGLDGESVYPRGGHRRRWDCGGSRRLSAFQRHYEEGAGAAGTADFEADGGAVEGGVRAARFRLYNG